MNSETRLQNNFENSGELTGELRLNKISELTFKLYLLNLENEGLPGSENFTLIGDPVGYSSAENSPQCSMQVEAAFAATLDPRVEEWAKTDRNNKEALALALRNLITGKVLTGQKILDLGCGVKPTFARVARAAGAEVYTVDVVPADGFEYRNEEQVDPKVLTTERDNHIEIDLNDSKALQTILTRTKGNFDLVTSAHLDTGWHGYAFSEGGEIAMPLLKKDGIYFNANSLELKKGFKIKK